MDYIFAIKALLGSQMIHERTL